MKTVVIEMNKGIVRTSEDIWDKIKDKFSYIVTSTQENAIYVRVIGFTD